ncbi:hypothetical protein D3C86_1558440 [compost metagenome]
MVHGVGRAGGDLLIEDLEGLGGGAGLFGGAAQADKARVEGLRVGAQDLGRVALGVDGDEQDPQLVGIRAQQGLDLKGAGQRRRADVRALREAEKQHYRVAAVVGQPAFLAIGVLQQEVAGRHAGQVHAVQRRGIGAAAGQGQQG